MRRVCWIYCCFFVIVAATTVQGAAFFVDPAGSDSNSGISATSPFQTIQRAIDEAEITPGPDMIQIASGEYVENLSIEDDEKLTLSGSGSSTVIAADPDENVIEIEGGDVTLSGLEVIGGDDGINAEDMTSLTVRNVVVTGNGDKGLKAEDIISVHITGCTFSQNDGDGINLEGVDVAHISGVTLSENSDGIDIEESGDINISQMTAIENEDEGVEVDDTKSVSINGATVSDNDDDGLDLDDTQLISLVSVESTGNTGNGLQIEAQDDFDTESLTVVNSVFSNNDEDGIKIIEDPGVVHEVRLTNTTARENAESGLDIEISGSLKLTRVISKDNGLDDVIITP